jgi:hypothetical protein
VVDNNNIDITVHTPDEKAYHTDISAYGTTIPRATKDGGSMGFDPNKPGVVIVDPDMEDGNLEVDFSKLAGVEGYSSKMQQAAGASSSGEAAFTAISAMAKELEATKEEVPSPTPPSPSKESSDMNKPKLRVPKSAQAAPATEVAPSAPSTEASQLSEMLVEQGQVLSSLMTQVEALQTPVQDTTSSEQAEEETEALETEILGMHFLGMDAPIKPQKEIYFEMPQAGTMGARYHDVVEGSNCIALVYDTRYEDGYQWIPPALGDTKIHMTLPRENKTYVCSSLGVHFHIGVLDVVVLFKHGSETNKED